MKIIKYRQKYITFHNKILDISYYENKKKDKTIFNNIISDLGQFLFFFFHHSI
jgi:hypothetical protein